MANVLADLALEAEAAQLLAFRLAAAFDASAGDAAERALQRVLTPIAKYWLCKRMTAGGGGGDGSAWAATATSRRARSRGSTARRR